MAERRSRVAFLWIDIQVETDQSGGLWKDQRDGKEGKIELNQQVYEKNKCQAYLLEAEFPFKKQYVAAEYQI